MSASFVPPTDRSTRTCSMVQGVMTGLRPVLPDPLSGDEPGDALIVTTERRLQRLAIVACDTGARFEREGVAHDPVAWMLAPRALFNGANALKACQDRSAFVHASLLHGLSLGFDADPDEMEALAEGDDDDCWDDAVEEAPMPSPTTVMRLYTCTIEGRFGRQGRHVQAFCAMVAADEEVVRRRLRVRYGERLGDAAIVEAGFDPKGGLARSLLSSGISRMLSSVAGDPTSDFGSGLDLHVEQRFAA